MKRQFLILLALTLVITSLLCACGEEPADVLSGIDTSAPYVAELPEVKPQSGSTPDEPDAPEGTQLIGTVVNVDNTVNVRGGPGTENAIIGTATSGDVFLVLQQNASEDWHKIQFGDAEGYIHADYLKVAKGTLPADAGSDAG